MKRRDWERYQGKPQTCGRPGSRSKATTRQATGATPEVDAMSAEQEDRAKNEGVGAATDEGLVCNIIMIHL